MELLKNMSSGICVLGVIDEVSYDLYTGGSVGSVASSGISATDHTRIRALHKASNDLRRDGLLVSLDYNRCHLWVFRVSSVSATADLPPEAHLLRSGKHKYTELLSAAERSPNADANQGAEWSPTAVYKYFVLSCMERVSFDLAATKMCQPVNLRSCMITKSGLITGDRARRSEVYALSDLSIDLNRDGRLLLSLRSRDHSDFRSLADIDERQAALGLFKGRCPVILVPSGREALFEGQLSEMSTTLKHQWRETFVDRLRERGITLNILDHDDSWLSMRLVQSEAMHLTLEWPAILCFWNPPAEDYFSCHNAFAESAPEMRFDAMSDSIDFALDWLRAAPIQNEALHGGRDACADVEVHDMVDDQTLRTMTAASPLDSRMGGSFADAQFYPTPSDGVSAHVSPEYVESAQSQNFDLMSQATPSGGEGEPSNTTIGIQIDTTVFDAELANNQGERTPPDVHSVIYPQQSTVAIPDKIKIVPNPTSDPSHKRLSASNTTHKSSGYDVLSAGVSAKEPSAVRRLVLYKEECMAPKRDVVSDYSRADTSAARLDRVKQELRNLALNLPLKPPSTPETRDMHHVSFSPTFTMSDRKYTRAGRFALPSPQRARGNMKAGEIFRPSSIRSRDRAEHPSSVSHVRRGTGLPNPRTDKESQDDTDSISDSEEENSDTNEKSMKRRRLAGTPAKTVSIPQVLIDTVEENKKNQIRLRTAMSALLVQTFCTSLSALPVLPRTITDNVHSMWPIDARWKEVLAQLCTMQLINGQPFERQTQSKAWDSTSSRPLSLIAPFHQRTGDSSMAHSQTLGTGMLNLDSHILKNDGVDIHFIKPSNISLERGNTPWEISPSAPAYWETLGLEPMWGEKDVAAFCLTFGDFDFGDGISRFMDALADAWNALRLGSHTVASFSADSDYVRPVTPKYGAGVDQTVTAMHTLMTDCRKLGSFIARTYSREQQIVVYIVDPIGEAALIAYCDCYRALLGAMQKSDHGRPINDVVLQIVNVKAIASPGESLFFAPEAAVALSHEVYGRFVPNETMSRGDLSIRSGASIMLAEPAKASVNLQLTDKPNAEEVLEHMSLHIGYSISSDRNWVTATWTDNSGKYQHVASYRVEAEVTLKAILTEIWATTLDIIRRRRVKWMLFVAKTSRYSIAEEYFWRSLAAMDTEGMSAILHLISVDTRPIPDITFQPPWPSIKTDTPSPAPPSSQHQEMLSIPMATPNPISPAAAVATATASPAPFPTPATPSAFDALASAADADPAARHTDKVDESWGIILPHGLNVSDTPLAYRPALASGYLLKRTGVHEHDPPVLLEVNLLGVYRCTQEDRGARVKGDEPRLLKEVLKDYRNLSLLARLRRQESTASVRPWHIAAAIKGAEGLQRCMRHVRWIEKEDNRKV